MDVFEALRRRRTARYFEPQGLLLQREMIEELIAHSCQAPSEFNLEPWRFIVVRDQERKELLYQCAYRQEMVRDAAAVVVVCGDTRGYERAGRVVSEWAGLGLVASGDVAGVEASIRAAYEGNERARMMMAVRNPSFVAMSLMLLATEQGIATAPIVSFSEDALRRAFHVPDRYVPVMLVAMGMASTMKAQPARSPRVAASEVIFHEDMARAEP